MTAAEKKLIIEKGSDYLAMFRVPHDDGITTRDLTGWTWEVKVYKVTDVSNPVAVVTGLAGSRGEDVANGNVDIYLDSASAIQSLPCKPDSQTESILVDDPFATEYNYRYTITLIEGGSSPKREMRIARGKLAVRV